VVAPCAEFEPVVEWPATPEEDLAGVEALGAGADFAGFEGLSEDAWEARDRLAKTNRIATVGRRTFGRRMMDLRMRFSILLLSMGFATRDKGASLVVLTLR
jgi:hypothetical protein